MPSLSQIVRTITMKTFHFPGRRELPLGLRPTSSTAPEEVLPPSPPPMASGIGLIGPIAPTATERSPMSPMSPMPYGSVGGAFCKTRSSPRSTCGPAPRRWRSSATMSEAYSPHRCPVGAGACPFSGDCDRHGAIMSFGPKQQCRRTKRVHHGHPRRTSISQSLHLHYTLP